MKPDLDLDALAEAIAQAQADRSSSWLTQQGRRLARWLGRLVRRFLIKAIGPAATALAIGALLAKLGIDLGSLLMPTVYASPFLAVAVASFVTHAWRQNEGHTYPIAVSQVGQAEPGQVASPVGQVQPDLARPATLPPATVTVIGVTALPTPAAALPQAVGQTIPIHYPAVEEEETP